MTNEWGGADPDETPTQSASEAGPDVTQPEGGRPSPGYDPRDSTMPTIPIFPPRPAGPRLGPLSPQERGIAPPHGLGGMTRNLRITLIALSVLLLGACCAASWGFASAFFPQPGAPVAAASTSTSGSPTSADTGSNFATDQPSAAPGDTPTVISGPTDTPGASPTDTPTSPPPTATSPPTPCPNPYCNPWGYNFIPGTLIYNPPNPQFCAVFPCINMFWRQVGYVVECKNGLFTHGGGFSGACSKNGGYYRTLYQHP